MRLIEAKCSDRVTETQQVTISPLTTDDGHDLRMQYQIASSQAELQIVEFFPPASITMCRVVMDVKPGSTAQRGVGVVLGSRICFGLVTMMLICQCSLVAGV